MDKRKPGTQLDTLTVLITNSLGTKGKERKRKGRKGKERKQALERPGHSWT